MKIDELLKKGISQLDNIEENSLKVKLLLSNVLNVPKEYLIIHNEEEIRKEKENEFFEKVKRLKENEPIQYIINSQEFMGLNFYVDKNVLIPQPDTEILVEEVIKISNKIEHTNLKILDMCTGSGAIAISLSKYIKNSDIIASDISEMALKIANKNAQSNNGKVKFIKSDLFENFSMENKFDIILSNPPYIKSKIIESLSQEVKCEPLIALDGGEDGLKFYRKIAREAKKFLKEKSYLAFEIGYDQKQEVKNILKENEYENIYSKKDLSGNDRVIIAQNK